MGVFIFENVFKLKNKDDLKYEDVENINTNPINKKTAAGTGFYGPVVLPK